MSRLDFMKKLEKKDSQIGIIGLGYVGLPLACLFSKKYRVVGFDVDQTRIEELNRCFDRTSEVTDLNSYKSNQLEFTHDKCKLSDCTIFIIAVPTPVDEFKIPDLTAVKSASLLVGEVMQPGSIVVYESTVFPGCTEKICKPILENASKLECNKDFNLGYSPERVVPGDKKRTIEKIVKIVSGSTEETTDILSDVYGSIIEAGIHRAPSIAVAEAAKAVENSQRDLNIAFVNELALLFDKIGIDTLDVLEAAGTKWNFLPFQPGVVGGHCIGVDPYYLKYLANGIGFHTDVISSGRRINDGMAEFVASKVLNFLTNADLRLDRKFRVGILGLTFKENVPDLRNSKVFDTINHLHSYGIEVFVFDPVANHDEIQSSEKFKMVDWDNMPICDTLVIAVPHEMFKKELGLNNLSQKIGKSKVIMDLKGMLDRKEAQDMGIKLWRL